MHTKNLARERFYTPLRGKATYLRDWQHNPVKLDQIPAGENVGLLLEQVGLTDIDLDSPEIKAILPRFVRTNTLTIGRGGVASHYLYSPELPNDEDMKDLGGHKMVEIRNKGKQVIFQARADAPRPHGPLTIPYAPLSEGGYTDAIGAETVGHVVVQRGDRFLVSSFTRQQVEVLADEGGLSVLYC